MSIERDGLFKEAAMLVVSHNSGSTSLLQRKLKLGYNRACGIMQQLGEAGIVGEFDPLRPRKVLVKTQDELLKIIS